MKKVKGVLFTILMALFGVTPNTSADVRVMFDFDNTLVETRAEYDGSFQTDFILYRIENPENALVQSAFTPDQIGPRVLKVPARDFQILNKPVYMALTSDNLLVQRTLSALGQGQGLLGRLSPYKLSTGQSIIPGFYRIDPDFTFDHFFTPEDGSANHLLEDFKSSLKGNWQGPLWPLFAALLADVSTAGSVGINTARGHERSDWQALFDYMMTKKLITHSPDVDHVHGVSRPEYAIYDRTGSVSKRKAGVNLDYIKQQGGLRLGEGDWVASRDNPSIKEKQHVFVFGEDSPENIGRAVEKGRKLMQTRLHPVKVIIINAGTAQERRLSQWPEAFVLKTDGGMRPVLKSEILELLSEKGKRVYNKLKNPPNCLKLVGGGQ